MLIANKFVPFAAGFSRILLALLQTAGDAGAIIFFHRET